MQKACFLMARLKLLQQLSEVQQEMSILDEDTRCLEERINTYKTKYPFLPVSMYISSLVYINIPPANCVCGRVYCFHIVRPTDRVSVTFCFLNNFKNH